MAAVSQSKIPMIRAQNTASLPHTKIFDVLPLKVDEKVPHMWRQRIFFESDYRKSTKASPMLAAARRRQSSAQNGIFRFLKLGVARPREDRENPLQIACGCV